MSQILLVRESIDQSLEAQNAPVELVMTEEETSPSYDARHHK